MNICSAQDFRDVHKGSPGFIFGSGPSLENVPDDAFKKHPCIAINFAIFKMVHSTYFLTSDSASFARDNLHKFISDHVSETKKVIYNHAEGHGYPSQSYLEQVAETVGERFCIILVERYDGEVSRDSSKLWFAPNSTHHAAQLLWIMGCSPIVLLGCEFQSVDGLYSYTQLPSFKNTHYVEKYAEKLPNDYKSRLDYPLSSWANIKHLPILNGSGGRLQYPTISLAEAMKKYDT